MKPKFRLFLYLIIGPLFVASSTILAQGNNAKEQIYLDGVTKLQEALYMITEPKTIKPFGDIETWAHSFNEFSRAKTKFVSLSQLDVNYKDATKLMLLSKLALNEDLTAIVKELRKNREYKDRNSIVDFLVDVANGGYSNVNCLAETNPYVARAKEKQKAYYGFREPRLGEVLQTIYEINPSALHSVEGFDQIDAIRIGRRYAFNENDIDGWIESGNYFLAMFPKSTRLPSSMASDFRRLWSITKDKQYLKLNIDYLKIEKDREKDPRNRTVKQEEIDHYQSLLDQP